MQIQFDTNAKIAGIGLVPWTRLGPERWLPQYKIASLYGWDLDGVANAPQLVALATSEEAVPKLDRLNTQNLLEEPRFQAMLETQLEGYSFLTYKPVQVPAVLQAAGMRFLEGDLQLAERLENKAQFRQLFAQDLPFPAYKIIERSVLGDGHGKGVADIVLAGRSAVILQDDYLKGGRGTFVIRDAADIVSALAAVDTLGGGRQVVVSEFIDNAYERTVQCCVTRHGVFVGPLQKQIVSHPLLANLAAPEGDRFCGGEISRRDRFTGAYDEILRHARTIGGRLAEMGYRGIFGVDCLVTESGRVYILEVNPRITGMTPLLTMLYREGRDIPFYLLHILELANLDYEIVDASVDPSPAEGSLLVLHSRESHTSAITQHVSSGLYTADGTFVAQQLQLDVDIAEPQVLVQQYTHPGVRIRPGGRLATAFLNSPVLDEADNLNKQTEQLVQSLLSRIKLSKVES